MSGSVFVDRLEALVTLRPENLTDGSTVWDLSFRDGTVVHCVNEKTADEAFHLIAEGLRRATDGNLLIL